MVNKTVTAWSYSVLLDYERCPRIVRYKKLDRLPEPMNQYLERGIEVHSLAEEALLKPKSKVPQALARVAPRIELLRRAKAQPEVSYTFTRDFGGTTEWDDWAKAWCRVKLDAVVRCPDGSVEIDDWKTGQFRPEKSQDQLELYALAAAVATGTKKVTARLQYVDVGREVASIIATTASWLARAKARWIKRAAPLLADTKFKVRPGPQCNWCHFHRKKGGPCEAP